MKWAMYNFDTTSMSAFRVVTFQNWNYLAQNVVPNLLHQSYVPITTFTIITFCSHTKIHSNDLPFFVLPSVDINAPTPNVRALVRKQHQLRQLHAQHAALEVQTAAKSVIRARLSNCFAKLSRPILQIVVKNAIFLNGWMHNKTSFKPMKISISVWKESTWRFGQTNKQLFGVGRPLKIFGWRPRSRCSWCVRQNSGTMWSKVFLFFFKDCREITSKHVIDARPEIGMIKLSSDLDYDLEPKLPHKVD